MASKRARPTPFETPSDVASPTPAPPGLRKLNLYVSRHVQETEMWRSSLGPLFEKSPSPTAAMDRQLRLWGARAIPRMSKSSSSMNPPKRTAVAYDEDMLRHRSAHSEEEYERPGRLQRTLSHLSALSLLEACYRVPVHQARVRDLRQVHTRNHIDHVEQLSFASTIQEKPLGMSVGMDLYACEYTSKAARLAAGGVIEVTRSVVLGECQNAFAIVRPPGHHSKSTDPAGFCFFNNVAVGARSAQAMYRDRHPSEGPAKILIVDWDVHHCDGTEEIFYDDASVLVFSIHQYGSKKGHVLRQKKHKTEAGVSAPPPGDCTEQEQPLEAGDVKAIAVDDLAALLDDDHDVPQEETPRPEREQPPTSAPERNELPVYIPEGPPLNNRTRRQRPVVDYAALAAKIDDQAAANYFCILELSALQEHSGASAEDEAAPVVGNSGQRKTLAPAHGHFRGDTDGESQEGDSDNGNDSLFYPGTGHINRIGGSVEQAPAAQGRNVNVPWPTTQFGDLEYYMVLQELLVPMATEFQPDFIFISCGFDCLTGDLLGSMNVTPTGMYWMTHLLTTLCPRVISVLEGGYNLSNVAKGTEAVLRALMEASGNSIPDNSRMLVDQCKYLIDQVKATHRPYWKCFQE